MGEGRKRMRPKRRYPTFYEKAVPIALAVIAAVIVLLLAVILSVAMGWLPAGS